MLNSWTEPVPCVAHGCGCPWLKRFPKNVTDIFHLQIDQTITITVSASVAILYTLIGGMYSVAYTDVIQVQINKIF